MFFIIAASSAANVCGIIRISSAEDTLTLKRLSTHHNRPSDTVEIPSRYRRDTVGMLLAIYERLTREIREAIEAHRECPVDKE